MGNGRGALGVRTPMLTPVANAEADDRKLLLDRDGSNGGGQDVEYTLKPAKRAYASTARYI